MVMRVRYCSAPRIQATQISTQTTTQITTQNRVWRRCLPIVLLAALPLALSACSGLSDEPRIVASLSPAQLTAMAPAPTETVQPTVSTSSNTSSNTSSSAPSSPSTGASTSAAAQPTVQATAQATAQTTAQTSVQPTTQAVTQAATAIGTQDAVTVTGTVSGSVTNGTSGATIPPNLPLVLHMVDQDSKEDTFKATADAAGSFTFKDVPIRADRAYYVTTTYLDRPFSSDFAMGDTTTRSIALPIKIYEATSNADVISISSMTTRIMVSADGLQIAQITRFKNTSDRIYTTDKPNGKGGYASVTIALPHGASIMGFSDDETRYTISQDGSTVTDNSPVLPGDDHSIHVVYTLPYRDGMTIDQPVNYPVDGNVQLMVSPETISASSAQLPSLGLQTQQGVSVKAYGGTTTLTAGSTLRYQLTGTVGAAANSATTSASGGFLSREMIVGLLIGLGIGIICVGLFFLVRERMTGQPGKADGENRQRIDFLVGQLARLDDEHANGVIGKSAYSKRRRRLKLQLAKLMKE